MSQNEPQEISCEEHEWYMILTPRVTDNRLVDFKHPFWERACRLCNYHEWALGENKANGNWTPDFRGDMSWHEFMRKYYGPRA